MRYVPWSEEVTLYGMIWIKYLDQISGSILAALQTCSAVVLYLTSTEYEFPRIVMRDRKFPPLHGHDGVTCSVRDGYF
ncbi:hypothetical protein P152DRAFT_461201 [Eremomyces bilateralis CBS 781.70]|uniref:Uncharacterized protein n=1 Tax=Eremomyces bilateralis CBS 781.70 TaxID=1392243 RepID=A0A6G1FW10_9PEZI|nr:uncharacterized protein P152DRAFT_461201 [Eremomyces bilateralis CBS 781.70]KAF1809809.1 hypothetical protein P152DRAFT_461201 [Eremomyces bilateralis CBS 781.70]